jgi:hypothetical protein
MTALSGKFAEVHFGSCNWLEFESVDMEEGSEPQPYNSRSGAGHTQSVAGVNSGSGTLTGFIDPDDLLWGQITSGSTYTMTLKHRTTAEVAGSGTIRIGKISRSANRDGTPQTLSVAFVTESWTEPS